MSNYETHSLTHLMDWLHDAIGADIQAERIYEAIMDVLNEQEQDCKIKLSNIQSLRKLLSSNSTTSSNDYCN